jgi:hypothetical protein
MENAMTQSPTIRRHHDGAIDYDFYRKQAASLRSQTLRDGKLLKTAFKFTLLRVVALIVVVMFAVVVHDNRRADVAAHIQTNDTTAMKAVH